jgi:AraC family transcriptional regulator of adaptative response/methylated-DNA-[protein]-cysteine methyltransferase
MSSRKSRIDWPRVLLDACRLIETEEQSATLEQLSVALGISASELQRQFSRRLGVSPRAYAQSLALHRLANRLQQSGSTLDAIYSSGFNSVSRAYANAVVQLGVAPAKLKKEIDIGWWLGLSDLGWMLMAATDKGICWLAFGDAPGEMLQALHEAFPLARFRNDEKRLRDWFGQVRDFVLLPREALDLPVDIQGTAFQASVWNALRKIPLGATVTYGALAETLGSPSAARAVASACASNRVALLIPCHRVIGVKGRTSGYRWGVERKRALLQREKEQ